MIIIFAKVPREIIYNKELNNKRVLSFIFLVFRSSLDDTISFSLDSIINWAGLKKSRNKGKSNNIFYDLILELKKDNYINGFDEKDFYGNNLVTANLNMGKVYPSGNFGIVSVKEYSEINNYKCKNPRINTSVLVLVLAYIRANILRRYDNELGFSKKDIKTKPEFCYRMFVDIENDIGIHRNTISKCVDILVELDILVTQVMPRYRDENGNWHTEATLFASKYRYDKYERIVEDYNYEEELRYGKQYLMDKKYVSKKFYQDTEIVN